MEIENYKAHKGSRAEPSKILSVKLTFNGVARNFFVGESRRRLGQRCGGRQRRQKNFESLQKLSILVKNVAKLFKNFSFIFGHFPDFIEIK